MFMENIEKNTGDLYSDCFRLFNGDQWLAQGELLADQLGLTADQVRGKKCLDGGCGHGALVYQLHALGASEAVGIDLKPTPPQDFFKDIPTARFVQASLMQAPFADQTFDVVVSSGVLHHTINPEKGFSELARVLKPGGEFILGLYGKHGIFSYCLWIARIFTVKLPIIPKALVTKVIDWLKLNPIWRYQVLDYLYVPILRRYSPNEVRAMFAKYGINNPHRVSNITQDKAKKYVSRNTSYSYDYRALSSRLLFGHGFIVIKGTKA